MNRTTIHCGRTGFGSLKLAAAGAMPLRSLNWSPKLPAIVKLPCSAVRRSSDSTEATAEAPVHMHASTIVHSSRCHQRQKCSGFRHTGPLARARRPFRCSVGHAAVKRAAGIQLHREDVCSVPRAAAGGHPCRRWRRCPRLRVSACPAAHSRAAHPVAPCEQHHTRG